MAKGEEKGHIHPITAFIYRSYEIFSDLGFKVVRGPEIEEEKYNFDWLNIPPDHPARGMQDTFWLKPISEKKLLRTHTTSVDARFLEKNEPPFKIITPGKVFRNEATDATHEAQFYQLDGLVVDKDLNLGHLKWILENFYKRLLGGDIEFRWRRSYFSFVEPGVELDIKWGDDWVEVVGAGMLHPNVFKACGHDPEKWRGLAFGSTIDRLVMIKHGIPDIRLLYSGDLRFLEQF
jgi:phenylalanyl-tRNA synthetase alpha chain